MVLTVLSARKSATHRSLPRPPRTVAAPAPPFSVSLPAPPSRTSSPLPVVMLSLPDPSEMFIRSKLLKATEVSLLSEMRPALMDEKLPRSRL